MPAISQRHKGSNVLEPGRLKGQYTNPACQKEQVDRHIDGYSNHHLHTAQRYTGESKSSLTVRLSHSRAVERPLLIRPLIISSSRIVGSMLYWKNSTSRCRRSVSCMVTFTWLALPCAW